MIKTIRLEQVHNLAIADRAAAKAIRAFKEEWDGRWAFIHLSYNHKNGTAVIAMEKLADNSEHSEKDA